jgi:hypothetical protein
MWIISCTIVRKCMDVGAWVIIGNQIAALIQPISILPVSFNSNLYFVAVIVAVSRLALYSVPPTRSFQWRTVLLEVYRFEHVVIVFLSEEHPRRSVGIKFNTVNVVEIEWETPEQVTHWNREANVPVHVVVLCWHSRSKPQHLKLEDPENQKDLKAKMHKIGQESQRSVSLNKRS